jgi:hypothetical protein
MSAIINLEELNQFQRWGLQYGTQEINKAIKQQNDAIEAANAALPEGGTPQELIELYTEQTFAELQFGRLANDYWAKAEDQYIQGVVVPTLKALSPEQQLALRAQFGLPDIIKE